MYAVHTYTPISAYIHIRTHIYTHARTHTRSHTHTRARPRIITSAMSPTRSCRCRCRLVTNTSPRDAVSRCHRSQCGGLKLEPFEALSRLRRPCSSNGSAITVVCLVRLIVESVSSFYIYIGYTIGF